MRGEGTLFLLLQPTPAQRLADAHRRHRGSAGFVLPAHSGRTRRLVSVHLPGGWTQAVPRRGRHVRIQVVDRHAVQAGGVAVYNPLASTWSQGWPRAAVRRARCAGVRQGPTVRRHVAERVLPRASCAIAAASLLGMPRRRVPKGQRKADVSGRSRRDLAVRDESLKVSLLSSQMLGKRISAAGRPILIVLLFCSHWGGGGAVGGPQPRGGNPA